MRLTRLLLLPAATIALAACEEDSMSVNPRPPLGGVRFINSVPDAPRLDIRMTDGVQWSASSVTDGAGIGLAFRAGTIHWATEAGSRRIRVFPNDSILEVTTTLLHEAMVDVQAGRNVTLMLTGTIAANNLQFVEVVDDPPAVGAGQIAIRMVNASSTDQMPATADGYVVATTTTAPAGSPTWASIAPRTDSEYLVRSTGTFAVRTAPAGTTTPLYSATAPAGAAQAGLIGATAGFSAEGSAMSAYLFPRACPAVTPPLTVANCPATRGLSPAVVTSFQTPGVSYFMDLIPGAPTAATQ